MTKITEITVVGGGVIGLLTAGEFAKAGCSVTLIEKGQLGQESSWAGGGILLPLYPWRQSDAISNLVIRSLKLYPGLTTELLERTGIDPQWFQCGLLITQNPDNDAAEQWCRKHRIVCQPVGNTLPATLQSSPVNPIFLPDIAQVRNPRLLKSLQQDVALLGVKIIEDCQLTGVTLASSGRIQAIQTRCGKFAVNHLVIAAGAWTGQLFAKLFNPEQLIKLPPPEITPIKGQMLLFDAPPKLLPAIILEHDHYLIQRLDGKILAGSTVENDAFNKTTTQEAFTRLHEFAVNLLPALKSYPIIKHWAGLRPGTNAGIPYIDYYADCNISINAGHFRNGLAMGPASAELLVDLVLNRPCKLDAAPYKLPT